ncbi:MAG TPA: helix-turn-helix domain-containing protein [Chloroflexota bacterium]|nr:helix-turn-helix domain-containing protein [Chloroflexota bacterium]
MRVMDLSTRNARVPVEVEAAPAYELLMSLATFSHQSEIDSFDVGRAWFEHIETTVSAGLLADVKRFSLHSGMEWCHLLGLARESAPPRDVPSFLARLDATEPAELRLHMLGYYVHDDHHEIPREVMLQAAQGDRAAQEQIIARICAEDEEIDALRRVFALSPEETKRFLLEILRGWDREVFRAREPEVMPILWRDAEAKRRLIGTMPVERLVEVATNGVQYAPEAGIRRVILIPSFAFRPWTLISGHRDARIFCYAAADESLTADAEAAETRLVRLYKALADERRLRVLRSLVSGTYTLQELADEQGIGKSLMHHHMSALRAAGLVRVRLGHEKRFELRPDVIAEMPGLLDLYLRGPASEAGSRAVRRPASPHRVRGAAQPRQRRPQ